MLSYELASALPRYIRLQVTRNRDVRLELTFTGLTTDDVENITNDVIDFDVRPTRDSTTNLIHKSNGVGQHASSTGGRTQFLLSSTDVSDTGNIGAMSTYWFESIRGINGMGSTGEQVSWFAGPFEIHPF